MITYNVEVLRNGEWVHGLDYHNSWNETVAKKKKKWVKLGYDARVVEKEGKTNV